MATLTNAQKAALYDDYVRQSDLEQRKISKIKSEYAGNIPPEKEREIRLSEGIIQNLVHKLNALFVD